GFHNAADISPDQREERLTLLVNVVLKLLREEYKIEQNKPNKFHTPFWDPLPKVCSGLSISRAHLSRLSKEACGLAAHELVDALHVETVKDKMKESIRRFVEAMQAQCATGGLPTSAVGAST